MIDGRLKGAVGAQRMGPNKVARKKAEIADLRERLGHLAIGEKRVRDQDS